MQTNTAMNIDSRKFLFIVIIVLMAALLFMPNIQSVSAQAGTLTLSVTLTQAAASTLTITPTVTASMTPTVTQNPVPSATFTPTYAVATDIAEMKTLLHTINTNTGSSHSVGGFLRRMGEDNAFTLVWTVVTQPLLSLIWILLASVPVVNRLVSWWYNGLARLGLRRTPEPESVPAHPGEPVRASEAPRRNSRNPYVDFINMFVLIVVIFMFLPFTVQPTSPILAPQHVISTPGTEPILPTVAHTPTFTPVPTRTTSSSNPGNGPDNTPNPESEMIQLVKVEALGFGLLALFVILASRLYRNQPAAYEVNFAKVDLQEIAPSLLPACFVALIVIILPDPVEGLLMPLLVPFLLFGFFDVIRVYPNLYWKQLVLTHYAKIIYLSQFGAWFGFLSILLRYAAPFLGIYMYFWQRVIMNSRWEATLSNVPQMIRDFSPLVIAIFLAARSSRRITEIARANHIEAIRRSTEAIS